jgi:hypothetical protein
MAHNQLVMGVNVDYPVRFFVIAVIVQNTGEPPVEGGLKLLETEPVENGGEELYVGPGNEQIEVVESRGRPIERGIALPMAIGNALSTQLAAQSPDEGRYVSSACLGQRTFCTGRKQNGGIRKSGLCVHRYRL